MFSERTCKYTFALAVLVLTSLSAIGHSLANAGADADGPLRPSSGGD